MSNFSIIKQLLPSYDVVNPQQVVFPWGKALGEKQPRLG